MIKVIDKVYKSARMGAYQANNTKQQRIQDMQTYNIIQIHTNKVLKVKGINAKDALIKHYITVNHGKENLKTDSYRDKVISNIKDLDGYLCAYNYKVLKD